MIFSGTRLTKEQKERLERKVMFYSTPEGEKEIFNLMVDAKLFDICAEKDLPLRNYAIAKLTELGFNHEDKIRKAIHEMLQWKITGEETDDGND